MADVSTPIAITGATGFLGQHVQSKLRSAGYALRCLTRSQPTGLTPGAECIITDLDSKSSIKEALEGVQAVIYLAGTTRGRTLTDFQSANIDGVRNTAQVLAENFPNTPLLLMSSIAASVPELSHYGGSKAAGERAMKSSAHHNWTIFRPPAVYGEGDQELRSTFSTMRRGLVPRTGPPHQRIPFIEVTDLATAILAWVRNASACNQQTYAIDDGAELGYDWHSIATLIGPAQHFAISVPYPLLHALGWINLQLSKITGRAPMLTPGKARELSYLDWSCDNTAFTKATGWIPAVGLGDGVGRLFGDKKAVRC